MKASVKVQRNILSGVFNQVITIIFGITIPRLVLVNLGSEANGLANSINQAIIYLALLEGGIGWTIAQALYKPVAEDNHKDINGIMSAANIFYKNVGAWYLLGLIVIAILYALTIKTTFSKVTVFGIVILTGMPQVINFFFQGKFRTLLNVNGYGYVLNNLATVVYLGQSLAKIVLLVYGFGLVAIQGMYCAISLIQMIFILYYVKKVFPWLNLKEEPKKNSIGQRRSVFIHQISSFFFSNSDMIILTYCCNLEVVSVYTMYNMFYSMVNTFINNLTSSLTFLMGQTFSTDREDFLKIQNKFETLNMVITFACYSVLNACILPFLKLYTSGITDIEYIDMMLPFLFTAIQLLQSGRISYQKVIEFAGKFKETQWHATVELFLNVVVSIVAVIVFGIYGVLFGTIVALLFRSVMMISFACRKILKTSQCYVYKKWIINTIIFIAFQIIIQRINITPCGYLTIIAYGIVLMLVSLIIFFIPVKMYDESSFNFCVALLKKKCRIN